MDSFMAVAVQEAFLGLRTNEGGPFGAVIVRNGQIIAQGHNEVLRTNDPTAHAEIVAIRKAAALLGKFDLSDCEVYASCEPCPMCLAAIFWAKIPRLFYGCTRDDAAQIGFDDKYIYDAINGHTLDHRLEISPLDRERCLDAFREWQIKPDKVSY